MKTEIYFPILKNKDFCATFVLFVIVVVICFVLGHDLFVIAVLVFAFVFVFEDNVLYNFSVSHYSNRELPHPGNLKHLLLKIQS